jgi:hypothetical protein
LVGKAFCKLLKTRGADGGVWRSGAERLKT